MLLRKKAKRYMLEFEVNEWSCDLLLMEIKRHIKE